MARKLMTYIRDNVTIVDATDYLDEEFNKYNQEFSVFAKKVKAKPGISPKDAVMTDMPRFVFTYYKRLIE